MWLYCDEALCGHARARRYFDPKTSIGLILGTGSNACYVLPVERLTKWDHQDPSLLRPGAEVGRGTQLCVSVVCDFMCCCSQV